MRFASIRTSALAAASVVLAAVAGNASAAIVTSGPLTTVIPNDGIGLYQNVVTGGTYTGPATFPTAGSGGFNWDINLYGATTFTFFFSGSTTSGHDTAQPTTSYGNVAATATGPTLALAPGSTIGSSSLFSTSSSTANLTTGAPVYFGFRFTNEGATAAATDDVVNYGYAQVRLTNGAPGVLLGYAYESTGASITIPNVPEPTTLAALGLAGAVLGRRRRA